MCNQVKYVLLMTPYNQVYITVNKVEQSKILKIQ